MPLTQGCPIKTGSNPVRRPWRGCLREVGADKRPGRECAQAGGGGTHGEGWGVPMAPDERHSGIFKRKEEGMVGARMVSGLLSTARPGLQGPVDHVMDLRLYAQSNGKLWKRILVGRNTGLIC